jgi:hypothetical protein
MQDEELSQEKFHTLIKFVSEITEMQHQLNERDKANTELKEELTHLKRIEEESRTVAISLKEQLANSNTEKELLSEELDHAVKERKRIEEEFRAVTASLKEQLARREAEIELSKKNLQNEIQTWKPTLAFRSKFLLYSRPRKSKFLSINKNHI